MRRTSLTAALALLIIGCGIDGDPTAPEDPGLTLPDPVTLPEPEFAATTLATNVWTTKAPMPTAQRYFAGGVVNGVLYTVGGENSNDTPHTLVQAYTPGDNSWRTKAPLPSSRAYLNGAGVINGVLYVAGGLDASYMVTSDLFAYTQSTNTWTRKQVMLAGGAGGQWSDRREAVRVQHHQPVCNVSAL